MAPFPSPTKFNGGPFDGQVLLVDSAQERLTLAVNHRLVAMMSEAMSELPEGVEYTAVYVRQDEIESVSYRFMQLLPT